MIVVTHWGKCLHFDEDHSHTKESLHNLLPLVPLHWSLQDLLSKTFDNTDKLLHFPLADECGTKHAPQFRIHIKEWTKRNVNAPIIDRRLFIGKVPHGQYHVKCSFNTFMADLLRLLRSRFHCLFPLGLVGQRQQLSLMAVVMRNEFFFVSFVSRWFWHGVFWLL